MVSEQDKKIIANELQNGTITKGEVVAKYFRQVLESGDYDVIEGNVPIGKAIQKGVTMENFPDEMTQYYLESKKGCCLVFSTVMIKDLHDLGVDTCLITTAEEPGVRASVMYVDNDGLPYVANPVADIEFFTEQGINTAEQRATYFVGDNGSVKDDNGNVHNYSRIPLREFEKMYGQIWRLGDFYSKKNKGRLFSEVSSEMMDHPINVEELYRKLESKRSDIEATSQIATNPEAETPENR